ncbi:MAG: CARDB domain-containing protein [Planctomycetota bacterium]
MRIVLCVAALLTTLTQLLFASPVGAQDPDAAAVRDDMLPYRFETANLRVADMLTLPDGSKHLGKVMEWADRIVLFRLDGTTYAYDVMSVEEFEFRRTDAQGVVPNLPDLTVAYVERLPRDPSYHGHVISEDGLERLDIDAAATAWNLAPGANAVFKVHLLNAGAAPSSSVPVRVSIDGAVVHTATIDGLVPGGQSALQVEWAWQTGRHTLKVEVDPDGQGEEVVCWNNTFTEFTDAQPVAVVVAKDRYEAFRSVRNVVDSFCFEDWAQYQLRAMNGLMRASVYPSAPQGALERVRCDRILVVDDPTDPAQRAKWEARLRRDGRPDGLAEYGAVLVFGKVENKRVLPHHALRVAWDQLQELGRQLGLIDLDTTDTTIDQCLVVNRKDRYVQIRHIFPVRATLMYTTGGFRLSEQCVNALNAMRGRPRGCRGEYLSRLPKKTTIEVLSNSGAPLVGVVAEVFQLVSEGEYAGTISGYGRGDPLYSVETDERGRVTLLDQETPTHTTPGGFALGPNPFGKIAPDGSNGLLLLRLTHQGAEAYYFLRLFDCNVAFSRGHRDEYVHRLYTRFGDPGALERPPYIAIKLADHKTEMAPVDVYWCLPEGMTMTNIEEFRIYKRVGFATDDARPWLLDSIAVQKHWRWHFCAESTYFDELRYEGPYSLDTFFATSIVDKQGRESSLSAPGCVVYDKDCISLAMDREAAYITLAGDGPAQMLCWDGESGTQHFGVRTRAFKGYEPAFAGIAIDRSGRLVVADPENHVLAFYDRGDLVEVIPSRPWWPGFASDEPGEFYSPKDVAVDDNGRIYVADFQNNRVQILDPQGRFLSLLDEGFAFEGPHAVGCSHNRLCVTDQGGTRCRVYDLSREVPEFLRELPPVTQAGRALVSETDHIYIPAVVPDDYRKGIAVFVSDGKTAKLERIETEDVMGNYHRPRGLYLYPGGGKAWAFFVNEFPFDVHRCKLK